VLVFVLYEVEERIACVLISEAGIKIVFSKLSVCIHSGGNNLCSPFSSPNSAKPAKYPYFAFGSF